MWREGFCDEAQCRDKVRLRQEGKSGSGEAAAWRTAWGRGSGLGRVRGRATTRQRVEEHMCGGEGFPRSGDAYAAACTCMCT